MKSKPRMTTEINPRCAIDPVQLALLFWSDNVPSSNTGPALEAYAAKDWPLFKRLRDELLAGSLWTLGEHDILRQGFALISKVSGSTSSLTQPALKTTYDLESACADSNTRLNWGMKMPDHYSDLLTKARWYISSALPPVDSSLNKTIIERSRPGPGMALGTVNRYRTSVQWKFSATIPTCTPLAESYGKLLMTRYQKFWRPALSEFNIPWEIRLQQSNKVTYVEKDVTTLRPIAIESSLNVMLQLGVHSILTSVLAGLNNELPLTGQTRHREMARLASISRGMSTIDLSSASDTICIGLCKLLLPSDWFRLLYQLRSPDSIFKDGSVIKLNKMSSMGNGYTFALETLIFRALAKAVYPNETVSVFGDDIIVPEHSVFLLMDLLKFCGFKVNSSKSYFGDIPFRESCGADWHNGILITPLYWRASNKPLSTEVYDFLNRLPSRFNWKRVKNYLMVSLQSKGKINFVPYDAQDTDGLKAPVSYLTGIGALRKKSSTQSYCYRAIRFVPTKDRADQIPFTGLCALFNGTTVSTLPLRGIGNYRYKTVSTLSK